MTGLRSAALVASMLTVAGCAALPAILGITTAAAPIITSALGAYEQAAHDAQAQAGLPASDPLVVAMREGFAALAAADARAIAAASPVACLDPVPVGAPLPPPAVDTAALDAALEERIAKAVTAHLALKRLRARKIKAVPVVGDGGTDDAGKEGGA